MELAFAALQQLCAPMLDRLDRLPAPQRDALGVAFGLRAGDAPDRFLVGLAVLSLLAEVAEERPLLCVVDDAQWLDRASAQALVFVARRLLAESVALVFATREPSEELEGLPTLVVEGLRDGDARALLGSVLRVPLDERVRERIVAETRGNPLALLELPRGLTPAELAGGFGLPDAPGAVGADRGQLPAAARRRFRPRPSGCCWSRRRSRSATRCWCGGRPGGSGSGSGRRRRPTGCSRSARSVTFRHPLVRSAVYRAASPEDRQAVHRALADATDPEVDPDRRAWHLAQATSGSDEDVASELERSAGRAQARGGLAAAAAFLERADRADARARRGGRERALAAAQAKHQAGAFDAALRLAGHRRVRTAGRAPARPGRPAARSDRVRVEPRQRRSAAAAQGREATRAAGCQARARDLSRCVGRGDVRRPSGRRAAALRGGRARRAPRRRRPPSQPPRAAGSPPGWPGAADHRGHRQRRRC